MLARFVVKETGSERSALFVPDGFRLDSSKLQSLVGEQWEIEAQMLLSLDAGTVHPMQFAASALVQLPQFASMWADAQKHAARAGGDGSDGVALGIINDILFLKLKTIMASIIDACAIACNCIVIDRVNAKSPAAELLIEVALAKVGHPG